MASRTLEVRINADDNASAIFKKVGDSSKNMGDSIERAGDDAERSLDRIDDSAKRAGISLTEIGVLAGTAVSALTVLGSAYRDQERQVDGIERAYGEAAETILEMSDNVQDLTRYSNDAARESALVASSLSQNYELSAEQIEVLIERSADLAQIFGIDLVDAVTRTSAAIRGEGEAAERLSLNMSDAAVAARALDAGITNWNVPGAISEAEKAMFRFQVFLDDSAYAAGAAADAAADAGGGFRRMANEAQDAAQALGGALGPLGEIGAEMAPLAIAAPVVGAGFANLGRSALVARAGTAALALALNPVTIALGGIATVGGLVIENYRRQGESARNYAESIDILNNSLEELRLQGDEELADIGEGLQRDVDVAISKLDEFEDGALHFYEELDLARQNIDPTTYSNILTEDFNRAIDIADDVNLRIGEALSRPELDHEAYTDWVDQMLASITVTAEGSNVDEVLEEILTRPLSDFRAEAERTFNEVLGPFGLPSRHAPNVIPWEEFTETVRDNIEAQEDEISVSERVAATHGDSTTALYDLIEAQQIARQEFIASARAIGGFDDALSTINLAGLGNDASVLAENMTNASTAFDNTFRILVGNTNAIIGQADATQSWADELINVRGELGIIDDLLEGGFIDRTQYDAAQDAYDSIAISTENIGNNLRAVQAIQAPFIAESLEGLRQYTVELRLMDEQTQRTTLAFSDMQTVQSVLEVATLANSAAFRDLGPAGEQAIEGIFLGLAQTNPLALEVAESLGFIERTVDGGFTVNFDGLASAGSDMQLLTENVGNLVDTLREIHNLPPLDVPVTVDTQVTGPLAGDGGSLGLLAGGGNALLDYFGIDQEIEVPVTVTPSIQGNAAVGDGTGGAQNFRDLLDIPESVETTVTPTVDVQGAADVEAVQQTIESLPDSTTVSVVVDVDDSQLSELSFLGIGPIDNPTGGAAALPEYSIPVAVEVTGQEELAALAEGLLVLDLAEATVTIAADTAAAMSGMADVETEVGSTDELDATVSVYADVSNAMDNMNVVATSLENLNISTGTVLVNAINQASPVIGTVSGQLSLLDGRIATTYVDTVHRTFFNGQGGFAHGGIPSFATGGVVPFWAGEHGPEIAHFANGGTALLPHEGLYAAPPMTYVSPNNAVSNSYGSVNVTINIAGSVISEREMIDKTAEAMWSAEVEELISQRIGAGVRP